jgi:hypothetical protein
MQASLYLQMKANHFLLLPSKAFSKAFKTLRPVCSGHCNITRTVSSHLVALGQALSYCPTPQLTLGCLTLSCTV